MLPYGNGNVSPHPVGADSISARGIWRQHKHPFLIHSLPPPRGGFFVSIVIPHNFVAKSLFTLPKVNFPAQFLQGLSTHFVPPHGTNIPYSGIFFHTAPSAPQNTFRTVEREVVQRHVQIFGNSCNRKKVYSMLH